MGTERKESLLGEWRRARRQGLGGGQGEFLPSLADLPLEGVLISGGQGKISVQSLPRNWTFFVNSVPRLGQRGTYTGHPQAYFTACLCPLHSRVQTSHAQGPGKCRHWFSVLCALRHLGTGKSSVTDGSCKLSKLSDE